MKSGDYLQPKKTKAKPKEKRRLSTTFKPHASGVMDGWVEIDKEGDQVLQYSPPAGTKVFFNDSLLLDADEKRANTRQAFILPLRKAKYAMRVPARMSGGTNLW